MSHPLGNTQVELAIEKVQLFSNIYLTKLPPHIKNAFDDTVQTLVDELERLKKLSLPPDDWDNAPEWATYKATDKDGAMYWYDDPPRLGFDCWWSNDKASHPPECISHHYNDWKMSLEERPE